MDKSPDLIEILGKKGLLERLTEEEKKEGTKSWKFLSDSVKNKSYVREPYIGDDFIPDYNFYNSIGAIYPLLNREQKDEVVGEILSQFNGINFLYVQNNHTPFINEPLLLSDIAINNRIYWPGLHEDENLWKGKTFEKFRESQDSVEFKKLIDEDGLFNSHVKSDFLLAYAILRQDLGNFGEDYVRVANPSFLSRVVEGITNMRFYNVLEKTDIEKRKTRLFELLPKSVHSQIELFMPK